jgi:MFS transporter, DHA1 family, multidrug resistance protein
VTVVRSVSTPAPALARGLPAGPPPPVRGLLLLLGILTAIAPLSIDMIMGLAPILAPIAGSALLATLGWRAIFWVLAAFGLACVAGVLAILRDQPRRPAEPGSSSSAAAMLGATLRTYGHLLQHRAFTGYALTGGCAMAGMFAYIAGSPFVFIEQYGLTPGQYATLFGTNAVGLIAASQVNRLSLAGAPIGAILARAVHVTAGAGVALVVIAAIGTWPWPTIAAGLFVFVASLGFVVPNATALALADQGRDAGTASALLGALQFGAATLAGLAVGTWHDGSALPVATVMAVCGTGALAAQIVASRAGSS